MKKKYHCCPRNRGSRRSAFSCGGGRGKDALAGTHAGSSGCRAAGQAETGTRLALSRQREELPDNPYLHAEDHQRQGDVPQVNHPQEEEG